MGDTTNVPGEVVAVATPLSMSTEEMMFPLHDKVALLPAVILDGLAVSEHVGPPPPPPPGFTVTSAVQVAVCPVGLVTVPVYSVEFCRDGVLTEPETAGETEPTLLLMLNVSAFVFVHEREV